MYIFTVLLYCQRNVFFVSDVAFNDLFVVLSLTAGILFVAGKSCHGERMPILVYACDCDISIANTTVYTTHFLHVFFLCPSPLHSFVYHHHHTVSLLDALTSFPAITSHDSLLH